MAKHLTVSGHTIEYEANAPTARFLARVQALLDDPRSTEDEMIALVYGPDNPILDKTIFPGRGAVTREVLEHPVYRVLTDLLARKRLQETGTPVEKVAARYTMTVADAARELGITPDAVRRLIRAHRLPSWKRDGEYYLDPAAVRRESKGAERGPLARGAGVLRCVAGNTGKAYLLVKVAGHDEPIGAHAPLEEATLRKWRRIAVSTGGYGKLRFFELEHDPGASPEPLAFHDWSVTGPFRIVRKVNNPREARHAWEAFRPS